MKKFIKQYNQIWKDMGFITDGDNFAVNVFRGIFWITVIWIFLHLMIELLWVIDFLIDGNWN
ncbi:MAG: hypothetical protein ACO3UU_00080 [Minisyncoccia bacterium]